MKLKNFNIVNNCGNEHRTIMRIKDKCIIGCFTGSKDEAIDRIKNDYTGDDAIEYINKVNLLFSTDVTINSDVDVTADNNYAIRWASEYGHLKVVKYLVSQGADVTVVDDYAVRMASENGHLKVVKYLISQGADLTVNDIYAVRWASYNGHLKVVKYLVSQGADVTVVDDYAVRMASENGHLKVVKYLKSL